MGSASCEPLGTRLVLSGFIDADDLEHHRAGLHHRAPIFRLAFARSHSHFQRLCRHRFVRENPDENPAFTTQIVATGNSPGLDLLGGDPRMGQRLQAVFAESHGVATGGVAAVLAALAFSELDPFGHRCHKNYLLPRRGPPGRTSVSKTSSPYMPR